MLLLLGNDDVESVYNTFTWPCLDLMGHFSVLAKRAGYIVAMAPAESYLDPTTSQFDRSLSHLYPEWSDLQPNFRYHGHNTYAYLLAQVNDYPPSPNPLSPHATPLDYITPFHHITHAYLFINIFYLIVIIGCF